METTQVSVNVRMDKQNVAYTGNRILFSFKKEWNSDMCYNRMNFEIIYAEWNKPDTKGQMLYDPTYMGYLE